MKRRIVLHGPSTLTVSLPSSWAKKFSIKKGDEINVEEIGNELRITASGELKKGVKKINIGDNKRFGKSCITSSYRQGFDELHLDFEDNDYIRTVRDLVAKEITGFEIIKHTGKTCILKDLTGHSKDEFDSSLRRVWLLLLDMASEGYLAARNNSLSDLENITLMDYSVNKLSNYCIRILAKRGHSDHMKTSLFFHLIKTLEKIADSYKDLCNFYASSGMDKSHLEMFAKVNKCLEEFYEAFYNHHPDKIEKLFKDTKDLLNQNQTGSVQEIYLFSICKEIRELLSLFVELNLS